MSEQDSDRALGEKVYRVIQAYIWRRSEERSGHKYESFKNNKGENGRIKYPPAYREAVEKVCNDAFLAMRGRREQAFTEYFAGTIFSVPQWLPQQDYLDVTTALLQDWEKVKTLSMIAISANSAIAKGNQD